MEAIPDKVIEEIKTIWSFAPALLQFVVVGKDVYDKRYPEALFDGATTVMYLLDAMLLRIVTPETIGLEYIALPTTIVGGMVNIGYQQIKGVPSGSGADTDIQRNILRPVSLIGSIVIQAIVIAGVVQRGKKKTE